MIISNILIFVFLAGEFPISTATERQWKPAIACDGEKYLVVWEDTRKTGDYFNNDIWGQFVSKEGELIDTNFPICTVDSGQWNIDVAFGDSNYLVVWMDFRDASSHDIYGQLISADSTLIDTPFCICETGYWKSSPATLWGEESWLVTWDEHYDTDSTKIWGQFILSDGTMGGSKFSISSTNGNNYYPAMAFDGSNFMVIWSNTNLFYILGQIVDSSGGLIDTNLSIIKKGYHSDITFDRTNYLVVSTWDATEDTIVGQLVGIDGLPIGSPILISTNPPTTRGLPVVAWNGTNYLVVWEDFRNDRDIYGQWISSNGSLVNTNFAISSSWASDLMAAIACCDSSCLVVWGNTQGSDYDIYGRIVSFTGVEETRDKIQETKLEVYPNPFVRFAEIRCQMPDVRLQIYDMMGRLVKETRDKIIGKELIPGVYFMKAKDYEPIKIIKIGRVR